MKSFLGTILSNYTLREAMRMEVEEDVSFLVRNLPGLLGCLARYIAYKPLLGGVESAPFIHPGVRLVWMKNIHLGKRVLINSNSYLYGKGGIEIGDSTMISPNCSIISGGHVINNDLPLIEQPSEPRRIVIGAGCWIGVNSVVLPGVTVGEGSIIGAGAVVTHDTEPYSINVGIPARKTGERRPKPERFSSRNNPTL